MRSAISSTAGTGLTSMRRKYSRTKFEGLFGQSLIMQFNVDGVVVTSYSSKLGNCNVDSQCGGFPAVNKLFSLSLWDPVVFVQENS